MTWQDDDLDGWDELAPDYRWAVNRYQARSGRYQRDRIEPTNRDRWAAFGQVEASEERRRFGTS